MADQLGGRVTAPELAARVQREIDGVYAESAIRTADGQLRGAMDFTGEWPTPLPSPVWSWWVELAAMALDNPTGLGQRGVGSEQEQWLITRRDKVLSDAARWVTTSGLLEQVAVTAPLWSYPPPPEWPG